MATITTPDLRKISHGLYFLLCHTQYGLTFPRTVATNRLHGAQVPVYSFKEAVGQFELSLGFDCRISAYPQYTEDYKKRDANDDLEYGIRMNGILADLLFIDIDKGTFHDSSSLKAVLFDTLDRIDKAFNQLCKPTILWTGNGYHIYLPVQLYGESWCLAHTDIFHELGARYVDRIFLQWAEQHLSGGQADPLHSKGLSFSNCLLRVPGSINSKNSCEPGKEEVKIIQRWNGERPYINYLLRDFRDYLIEQKSGKGNKKKTSPGTTAAVSITLANKFSTVWRK